METLSVKKCIRVKLPEAFELPRKFGVSWGCLTQGAFRGIDAVIAEGGRKGIHFRYVLPYDTIAKRYMAEYGQRERREGYGISRTLSRANSRYVSAALSQLFTQSVGPASKSIRRNSAPLSFRNLNTSV